MCSTGARHSERVRPIWNKTIFFLACSRVQTSAQWCNTQGAESPYIIVMSVKAVGNRNKGKKSQCSFLIIQLIRVKSTQHLSSDSHCVRSSDWCRNCRLPDTKTLCAGEITHVYLCGNLVFNLLLQDDLSNPEPWLLQSFSLRCNTN